MAKTDFEKKAEQLRSQIEDLRSNLDDAREGLERRSRDASSQIEDLRSNLDNVLKSYNHFMTVGADWVAQAQKPVARAAKQARENVEGVGEGFSETGIPWWVPVAVVGFIGAGVWIYTMMTSGGTEQTTRQFTNYSAGSQPPISPTETPFTEPR